MTKKYFNEEQEQEVINYYLAPHMIKDVAAYFNVGVKIIKGVLNRNNIQSHNTDVLYQLRKQSYKEKHGIEHPMQSVEVKSKLKQSMLDKYGVENISQSPEVRQKITESFIKTYGVDNPNKSDLIKEKKRQTCLDRYGVDTPFQDKVAREKAKLSYLSKLGVDNPMKSDEIKNKAINTCIDKYGVTNYTKTDEFKDKSKQTNLERYGVEYYAMSIDFHKKAKKRYKYGDEQFDSFPELCFYMYAKSYNIDIERTPIKLTFKFQNKEHTYIPDFKVNNELVEIKGNQFLKEDGTWQCPFDHSQDALFEAKHLCAMQNNVKILYYDDYIFYVDWFITNGYDIEDYKVKQYYN